MDPFEDVMSTMHVASSLYVRMQLRAPYGVRFDSENQARLVVIASRAWWLVAHDLPQPVALTAGDCLIVKAATKFSLQDELGRKLIPCRKIFSEITGHTVKYGGEGVLTEMLSGALSFEAAAAEPLMALMPRLVHVRLDPSHAHLLQTTLQLIGLETSADGLGAGLVIVRLADVLFVQAVRAWCVAEQQPVGWLAGLRDRRLADRWRMYRARVLLRGSDLSLMEIAARSGYDTDTALSRAFRRSEGTAPGKWRRNDRSDRSASKRRASPRRRATATKPAA